MTGANPSNIGNNQFGSPRPFRELVCPICGSEFTTRSKTAIYCSRPCMKKYHKIKPLYPKELTQESLQHYLDYNPETGTFIWKSKASQSTKIGEVAGYVHKSSGYRKISFAGRDYAEHVLAWLFMTGELPDKDVDHKNHIPGDNRWENLRLDSEVQNNSNAKRRKDNTSGYKGVIKGNKKGTWYAIINANKQYYRLGTFLTPEAAALAYNEAAIKYHGEFACLNEVPCE